MIVYFDASALVKLFVREDDSDALRARHDIASDTVASWVAYTETRMAFARRARDGSIDPVALPPLVLALDQWFADATIVAFDRPIAEAAAAVGSRHGLRALDAIHLASALAVRASESDLIIACADRRLSEAARDEGFDVL